MTEETRIELPKGKHKKFADLYLKYMNATRAYQETYPKASYETSMVNSSKLLRNTKISAYIQDKLKEYQMDAEEALRRMSDIARGDMSDMMDVTSVGWALDMKKAQERGKTHLIKKVKQTTITKIGRKQDDDDEERTYLEVELYPADAALRDILKVHGRYNDVNVGGDIKILVEYANGNRNDPETPS